MALADKRSGMAVRSTVPTEAPSCDGVGSSMSSMTASDSTSTARGTVPAEAHLCDGAGCCTSAVAAPDALTAARATRMQKLRGPPKSIDAAVPSATKLHLMMRATLSGQRSPKTRLPSKLVQSERTIGSEVNPRPVQVAYDPVLPFRVAETRSFVLPLEVLSIRARVP